MGKTHNVHNVKAEETRGRSGGNVPFELTGASLVICDGGDKDIAHTRIRERDSTNRFSQ